MSMMGTIPVAFANPLPSLHPLDLLVGLCCGAGLRLAVYLRGKNAKKYRHGMEYGSYLKLVASKPDTRLILEMKSLSDYNREDLAAKGLTRRDDYA